MKSFVGRNAVKLNLPDNVKIHDVVSIMHSLPDKDQPAEIANPSPQASDLIPVDGEEEYAVNEILSHRKRGKGLQFLASWKGYPSHEAIWLPTRNFTDTGGAINQSFLEYTQRNDMLYQFWKT